jgi:Xaa-Pro aminopeptidase
MNESLARASFKGKVVIFKDPYESLSAYVKGKVLGVDSRSLSMRMAQKLRKLCRLKDYSDELARLRVKKKPAEVRAIQKAVRDTKEMLDGLDFRAAKTELDLKKQLMVMMAEKGLEQAFEPIVSTDRNTSYPH